MEQEFLSASFWRMGLLRRKLKCRGMFRRRVLFARTEGFFRHLNRPTQLPEHSTRQEEQILKEFQNNTLQPQRPWPFRYFSLWEIFWRQPSRSWDDTGRSEWGNWKDRAAVGTRTHPQPPSLLKQEGVAKKELISCITLNYMVPVPLFTE